MHPDVDSILISEEQIKKRIQELAVKLDKEYEGKRPLMVSILKGSVMFYADLLRAMSIPVEMDFMAISSYGAGAKSSGEVKLIKDLDRKIEGRDVVIVEDIIGLHALVPETHALFEKARVCQDLRAAR